MSGAIVCLLLVAVCRWRRIRLRRFAFVVLVPGVVSHAWASIHCMASFSEAKFPVLSYFQEGDVWPVRGDKELFAPAANRQWPAVAAAIPRRLDIISQPPRGTGSKGTLRTGSAPKNGGLPPQSANSSANAAAEM